MRKMILTLGIVIALAACVPPGGHPAYVVDERPEAPRYQTFPCTETPVGDDDSACASWVHWVHDEAGNRASFITVCGPLWLRTREDMPLNEVGVPTCGVPATTGV